MMGTVAHKLDDVRGCQALRVQTKALVLVLVPGLILQSMHWQCRLPSYVNNMSPMVQVELPTMDGAVVQGAPALPPALPLLAVGRQGQAETI